MSRPITGPLAAHLIGRQADVGDCLMIERRDGLRVGFTTRDVAIVADLGEGDETYSAGVSISALTLAAGLDASSAELRGPIGPVVERDALMGGTWDDAEAWLFRASVAVSGMAPLLHGRIREAQAVGEEFVFQLRGEADRLNQVIGRQLSPYCDADLGDARCTFDLVPVAATVTAVTDSLRFTVSFAGSYADDYFVDGNVRFLTGDLAGELPVEMFAWSAAGAVVMFEPLADAPQVGDTLELRRGCPKTREACRDIFANIAHFRGFPEVPGTDQVLKYAVPGSAGA